MKKLLILSSVIILSAIGARAQGYFNANNAAKLDCEPIPILEFSAVARTSTLPPMAAGGWALEAQKTCHVEAQEAPSTGRSTGDRPGCPGWITLGDHHRRAPPPLLDAAGRCGRVEWATTTPRIIPCSTFGGGVGGLPLDCSGDDPPCWTPQESCVSCHRSADTTVLAVGWGVCGLPPAP